MDRSSLKKIIPAAIFLLITAIALGASGVAWFSMNRRTSAGGAQILLTQPDNLQATVTVHHPLGVQDGVTYFDMTASDDHAMAQYSILSNDNRQLLIRISFEAAQTGISLSALTDTDYFMDGETHPLLASADGRGDTYNNCLSSIVTVALVSVTESIYKDAAAYAVASFGTPESFAVDGETVTMRGEIPLLTEADVTEIYILLDYDNDLITRIFSENIGNTALEGGAEGNMIDSVYYVMDFTFSLTKKDETN